MNEALSYAVSMDVRTYLALSSMPPPPPRLISSSLATLSYPWALLVLLRSLSPDCLLNDHHRLFIMEEHPARSRPRSLVPM